MNYKLRFIILATLLALFLAPAPSVAAAGNWDGKVIFGNYTLKSGESLNGDLVVMSGVVLVENKAVVNGSVVLIGGTLTIEGEITGDAVLIGGTVRLGNTAHIHGNLITVGASLQQDENARIDGEVVTNIPAPEIDIPSAPAAPALPMVPERSGGVLGKVAVAIGRVLVVTLLAILSMLFLQQPAERIGYAIVRQPIIVGGVGLLVVVLSPLVIVLLAVTLILIPVAFVVVLALILAWLLGIIAIGLEVGQRFTATIHREWPVVLTAGFGTFLTMSVLELLRAIPCLGWLVSVLFGLLAIGGCAVTLFGSRAYPPSPAPAVPSAAPPSFDQPAG